MRQDLITLWKQHEPIHVYVAGPLTRGNGPHWINAATAARVGAQLMSHTNLVPFVPHLAMFWDMIADVSDESRWLKWSLTWLARCDCIVLSQPHAELEGGTLGECIWAKNVGMPILRTPAALINLLMGEPHAFDEVQAFEVPEMRPLGPGLESTLARRWRFERGLP